MKEEKTSVLVDAPESMSSALDAAIMRAGYLFPDYRIEKRPGAICAQGVPENKHAAVRQELAYLLYREHIRVEFAPYRRKALARVYGAP